MKDLKDRREELGTATTLAIFEDTRKKNLKKGYWVRPSIRVQPPHRATTLIFSSIPVEDLGVCALHADRLYVLRLL